MRRTRSNALPSLVLSALSLLVSNSDATIHVVRPDGSGDFATIQAAIDAAVDGDVIELTDGVFQGAGNRNILYGTTELTIRSQSGDPSTCVVDCDGSGSERFGFGIGNYLGTDQVLERITITNAYSPGVDGGGIRCWGPATISHCTVRNCEARSGGGLLCEDFSAPTVIGCIFESNESGTYGGGAFCYNSDATFVDCIFRYNRASEGAGVGSASFDTVLLGCTFTENGPYSAFSGAFELISGCTFYGNGAGLLAWPGVITNTIFAFNRTSIYCYTSEAPELSCCDIYGNTTGDWVDCVADQLGVRGNIAADPLFCKPEKGNFYLDETSPCRPFSPESPDCDRMGAWPVGCGATPTTRLSWGQVKLAFR